MCRRAVLLDLKQEELRTNPGLPGGVYYRQLDIIGVF